MQQGAGASPFFVNDKNGRPNSALDLNGGYMVVPPGVYFSTAYTISTWIMPVQVGVYARVLDFGNGQNSDNIVLVQSTSSSYMQPVLIEFDSNVEFFRLILTQTLPLQSWYFLTATYDGTTPLLYINGVALTATSTAYTMPRSVVRSSNYIGKSNWADGMSYSLLDDLRIYNRALTSAEITALMNAT